MKKLQGIIILLLLTIPWRLSFAYEIGTHARVTFEAFNRSVLNGAQIYQAFGLEYSSNLFGITYFDVSGGLVKSRQKKSYEGDIILKDLKLSGQEQTVQGWLMRGAIREDDFRWYLGADNPQDDPYNSGVSVPGFQAFAEDNRIFNHFYDPVNLTALTYIPHAKDAPTWAAGVEDVFMQPNTEDSNRRNHFTIRDARVAQWRALTGQDRNGNTGVGPNGQQADESVRKAYWATLFRSLGDVVHLVQDMGQPQHTRNEPHAPVNSYSKKIYERYTEARALGRNFRCAGGSPQPIPVAPLSYDSYPIPKFNRYSEFFSTVPTDQNGDITTGRGLADYSNRGFFTAGSNINNTDYALPDPNPSAYQATQLILTSPCIPTGINSELLNGVVSDAITGEHSIAALSTRGLWNVPVFPGVLQTVDYSLSEDVYKAMGDLLIPRAVAYSAGLINYYFRGLLDIRLEGYNQDDLIISFQNLTENDTLYSNNGNSQLIVTYRYTDSNQNEVFGTSDIVPMAAGDDVVPQGTSQSYTFTFPSAIPVGADDLEFRLVFLGTLGYEADAIAVGYKPMTSPGFIVQPSQLPADGIAGLRHVYKEDGVWKLSTETGLQVGNVDWKGHDPDDVLSFEGPQSRYFFRTNRSGYSSSIYRRGKLWAQVPGSWVHGVGIRAFNNKRHLTVISYARGIGMLYVYSRELADTYPNNDLYDQNTNPLGWKLLASYDTNSIGHPSTPIFMNASGTEAQGLYGYDNLPTFGTTGFRFQTRIKLKITGDLVTRTDIDSRGSYILSPVQLATFTSSFTPAFGSIQYSAGQACPTIATECLSYCDSSHTICSHSKYDYSAVSVRKDFHSTNYAIEQEKVIAVDYIGDKEVFATFEHAGTSGAITKDTSNNVNDLYDSTYDCSTNSLVTRDTSRTLSETYNYSDNWGTRISIGATDIRTSWVDGSSLYSASDIFTNSDVQQGGTIITSDQARQFTYSGGTNGDNFTRRSKMIFMDLRHNNVVYSQSKSVHSAASGSTGIPEEILENHTNQHLYSQFSNLAGVLTPMHSWAGNVETSSSTRTFAIFNTFYCKNEVNDNAPNPSIGTYSPNLTWMFMHDEAIKGSDTQSLQGYARDMNGNMFASQTLWEEQFPPPVGQTGPQVVGKWNYLTDGDPVALFGLTGPDPHFTKIGLY